MTDAGYIALGYVAVFGSVGAYVAWVLRRGRTLSRQLPPEERRWT
jgi:hypothetical protein